MNKINHGDAIRQRIRERIAALGTNVAEVERRSGFAHSYLHDLLSGKKHSMRGDALERLAEALETTELWLLRGLGAEQIERSVPQVESTPTGTLSSSIAALADEITEVQPTIVTQIVIDSLNVATGEMVCRVDAGPKGHRGFVVDPVVFLPNNPYARALASRRLLAVEAKPLILKNEQRLLIIIDVASEQGNAQRLVSP